MESHNWWSTAHDSESNSSNEDENSDIDSDNEESENFVGSLINYIGSRKCDALGDATSSLTILRSYFPYAPSNAMYIQH